MATTKRIVPLIEMGLRARLDANNKILGFIDAQGTDVMLAVADADGQIGTAEGGVTAFRSDVAPVNSVAPALTGEGTVGVEVTTDDGTWSGADNVYTYQWYLGAAAIEGATTDAYTPLEAQLGGSLTCQVTATNPAGSATEASAAAAVINVVPVNSVAPTITGTGLVGAEHTAVNGTWSGAANVYTYQWKMAGAPIGGATDQTYTPLVGDVGSNLTVTVTATNDEGNASATSAAVVVNVVPANTVPPAITGDGTVGVEMTTDNGTFTGSGNAYTYQWELDGAPIAAATAAAYTPLEAQVGGDLTCVVTATNSVGNSATETAAVTANVVPVNSVLPALTGVGAVGIEVTTNDGTWSGDGNVYTYQWELDGAEIVGATTAAYTPLIGDDGGVLTCDVTATNALGNAMATSATVTVNVVPANSVLPTIVGAGNVGVELTSTDGTWTGTGNVYTYQWELDGVAIGGAAAATYTPLEAQIGAALRLEVTATNSAGAVMAASVAKVVIAA
jgi:hypothetical protein